MIKRVLRLTGPDSFVRFLKLRFPVRLSDGIDREQAIEYLTNQIATASKGAIDAKKATQAVLEREATLHTGIGSGLAIPHARIAGIRKPMIVVGISEEGIDFDAPDGIPARVVVLLLAPSSANTLLLQIYADIAKTFANDTALKRIIEAKTATEFVAALKVSRQENR